MRTAACDIQTESAPPTATAVSRATTVCRCPANASDEHVLKRIRSDVVSAVQRGVLHNVAETDVVSSECMDPPQRLRAGYRPAPRGSSRFVVVRGGALKEYLLHEADITMDRTERLPPRMVALVFKASGRRQSAARDEAEETPLDVVKLQVRGAQAGRCIDRCPVHSIPQRLLASVQ